MSLMSMSDWIYGPAEIEVRTIRVKGGPEPLKKKINKISGSKREDRLSDPFFLTGTKYQFG